jgi:hypothetical protein
LDTSHLSQAFQDGLKIEDADFGEIALRHYPLGELMLPTGKVVACDPFVFPETPPFTLDLPPGSYPVIACVADFTSNGDHRVAYAILRLSTQEPVRWEMATRPEQDMSTLEEGYIFGYPVDAGTGCFMDAEAATALEKKLTTGGDYAETLIDEFYGDEDIARLNLVLDPETGVNSIFFPSGWGDGFYASYWGYAADNTIACLVTDFGVLPD